MSDPKDRTEPNAQASRRDEPLDERGLPRGYQLASDWELTPRQARQMHKSGEAVLVDCRTPREREVARIERTVHLPLQELPQRVDELAAHRGRRIVVHCHHGIRSMRVVHWLREQGFEDVWSMAGGIDVWSRDIDPNVPRY